MKRRGFFGALLLGAPAAALAGVEKVRAAAVAGADEREAAANRIRIEGTTTRFNHNAVEWKTHYRIKPECFEEVKK